MSEIRRARVLAAPLARIAQARRPRRAGTAVAHTGGAGGLALTPVPPAPSLTRVRRAVSLSADAGRVFAFHADLHNLPRVTPGPLRVRAAPGPSRAGDRQQIRIGFGPLHLNWLARIERLEPPRLIVDVQERGPFRVWQHAHLIRPEGTGCELSDVVDFRLVPGPLGATLDRLVVAPLLGLMFWARHRRTRRLLDRLT